MRAISKKAVDLQFYNPLKIGNNKVVVGILQFADDTLFIEEGNMSSVTALKVVLRWAKILTGLKINFFKSAVV